PKRGDVLQAREGRQALSRALGRGEVVGELHGALRPWERMLPPTVPSLIAEEPATATEPESAEALLDRAGWTDSDGNGIRQKGKEGLRLTLEVSAVPSDYPETLGTDYGPLAQRIASEWRTVGVDVSVRRDSWEELAHRVLDRHDFDVALLSLSTDADPDQSYLWTTQAYTEGLNAGQYSSRDVDAIYATAARRQDWQSRLELYTKIERRLALDVPAIPIGVTQAVLVYNTRLVGASPDYWSALQHTGVERWWVRDGQ
ncbi:MAG: ABC transporter substrate-binding protein, partial [Chloroflexota bacterium]|nr:ABC transporter substrate-binding protein [Chloroflexota bacterium]